MGVLSTRRVNPLIIPPDSLQMVLAKAKEDMKRNPQLTLPEDPNINIWNYYSIMKVTSYYHGKLSFGYFDYTTGRSVTSPSKIACTISVPIRR